MHSENMPRLNAEELRVLLSMYRTNPEGNQAHYRFLNPIEYRALCVSHYLTEAETSHGLVARLTTMGLQRAAKEIGK